MFTIQELEEATAPIFERIEEHDLDSRGKADSEEIVPEPSPHWRRKIEALEEANLMKQRAAAIFDMRCEQAETMGFRKMLSEEMVEALMGEKHTEGGDENEDEPRQSHEWFFNHHNEVILEGSACNWGGHPHDFLNVTQKGKWFLPPFNNIENWCCRFGKLDYLKREIPYGVVLRIQEVKKLNLFNVFNVMAPKDAWERDEDIDPIVVATIWEILPSEDEKDKREFATAGQAAHFFLAQW